MTGLLDIMAIDMGIESYTGESEESFAYRICYSALGQWCLKAAQNSIDGVVGTTKTNQTIVMKELLQRFTEMYPKIENRFKNERDAAWEVSRAIRRVYEETGYLITDDDNRNTLANYARSIVIGSQSLFFGLPNAAHTVNGLGVYCDSSTFKCSISEFLIRDSLTPEEYFLSSFDDINFQERDIAIEECEFFNPLAKKPPSLSWEKTMVTDNTIARKSDYGPYYRVKRGADGSMVFAIGTDEILDDSFISHEYRRLYFALKEHHSQSLRAYTKQLCEDYVELSLGGHLPYREYYLMLLTSWPARSAVDRTKFIIRSSFVSTIKNVLHNIGIVVD